ncbi:hypothetical protein T4B_11573 [Trichinella pseudospiralis]|uniref:Uncharacterized protein n=2 Tax=Trichinella pseudospiralis TaxID=6337 RepID=A0A0V1DWJ4_TRIPS|nr:hypothetical protein T4A_4103 [Trichinella pseudospiralis]KRY85933.1 hypothetical protein T4D_13997 [Trichinella pseudospiralis]KRZ20377.1 hypothetical protein T4B_11573 [Trichinella pseudospiralis]KRZ38796.1 hypothetical protein T4C_12380 [Trichinella pseudospiralis]
MQNDYYTDTPILSDEILYVHIFCLQSSTDFNYHFTTASNSCRTDQPDLKIQMVQILGRFNQDDKIGKRSHTNNVRTQNQ